MAYLLDGSVRKVGTQMRINAQLIDAANGQQLWAERYDGRLDDVFALQDNITRKIILALEMKLTVQRRKSRRGQGDPKPGSLRRLSQRSAELPAPDGRIPRRRKANLEKPCSSTRSSATPMPRWRWCTGVRAVCRASREASISTTSYSVRLATLKAHDFLKKAMKKPTALAYGLMSQIHLHRFLHDKALDAIDRALAMEPNDPDLYAWRSNILWFMGKSDEALESAKTAQRLDPNNPSLYQFHLGSAYIPDVDLKKGLSLLDWALSLNPELGAAALRQSIVYAMQDATIRRARRCRFSRNPGLQGPRSILKVLMAGFSFANPETSDRFSTALVKAGVPDHRADHCRLARDTLLKGREIKALLAGRRIVGISPTTGEPFACEWGKGGDFKYSRGAYPGKRQVLGRRRCAVRPVRQAL